MQLWNFLPNWQVEKYGDFAVIQVSTDDGSTWHYLQSSNMRPGSGFKDTKQELNAYGFAASFPEWITQECSLNDFIGQSILIRFGMLSDRGARYDGWHLKDIKIRNYSEIDFSSVDDEKSANTFNCYPNPVYKGRNLTVSLTNNSNNNQKCTIKIMDILGHVVYSNTYENFTNQLIAIPTSSF